MTTEERMKLYDDFHSGVRMSLDWLFKVVRSKETWTLCEMGQIADIMKDLATTEKAIAKANYYHTEHSEEVY